VSKIVLALLLSLLSIIVLYAGLNAVNGAYGLPRDFFYFAPVLSVTLLILSIKLILKAIQETDILNVAFDTTLKNEN
jgi:uncharacterized membrane protein YhdT